MTGMQLDQAIQRGILIPWQKSEPERFKTALQLLQVDKGGLTYQPPIGTFAHVAEIDFASMYPSLMVVHNLSPETVLCGCCQNEAVLEANYNVCEKRRGLIPLTLEPVIERRRRLLKQASKETADLKLRAMYETRRAALKWMLVSCFGYLGYLSSGRWVKQKAGKRFYFVDIQTTKTGSYGKRNLGSTQAPLQRAEFCNAGEVTLVHRQ